MKARTRTLLRRLILELVLLACLMQLVASCGVAQTAPEVDQSTPEATLRAMYRALEKGDAQLLESLLDPSDPTRTQLAEGLERMRSSGMTYELISVELFSISNDGTTALMSSSGQARLTQEGKVLLETDGSANYTLTNLDGKWYLVGLGQRPSPGWIKP